jgi:hypothetical protein
MEKGKIYLVAYTDGESSRVKDLKYKSEDELFFIFTNSKKLKEFIPKKSIQRVEERK